MAHSTVIERLVFPGHQIFNMMVGFLYLRRFKNSLSKVNVWSNYSLSCFKVSFCQFRCVLSLVVSDSSHKLNTAENQKLKHDRFALSKTHKFSLSPGIMANGKRLRWILMIIMNSMITDDEGRVPQSYTC